MPEQAEEIEEVRRVLDAVASLEAMHDPAEQAVRAGALLAEWPVQQAKLRGIRQQAVITMRAQGVSYRKIASALGISLARVQQIEAGERGSKPKPDPPAE
ncbi:hypothetical protein [Streptacidiphilus sp. PAMC 29251]